MRESSIHDLEDVMQLQVREPACKEVNTTTNALHISDGDSELGEPFKLSMLNSPTNGGRQQKKLKELSALSSPVTQNSERLGRGKTMDDGKSLRLDSFIDAVLRKRESCAPETEPMSEYTLNFTKQLHRVKYYWRGTSLNYPFTYMRLRGGDDAINYTEDYSSKRVNANEAYFN